MKKLINGLSRGLLILVFVYLVFSFFQGEYKVKEWPEEARFMSVGIVLLVTFIITLVTSLSESNE